MSADLIRAVTAAFPLPGHGDIRLTAAARGALGQIWRLDVDGTAFALKQLFEPLDESVVRLEVEYTNHLGVRAPHGFPDRAGRYVSPAKPYHLRLSSWIDGTKPDPTDAAAPGRLGEVLGRLHASAPDRDTELDGNPLDPWYYQPPAPDAWTEPVDARWAERLDNTRTTIADLTALAVPPAGRLVLTHRDLHPDNVLVMADGEFAVLDWDNLGPALPARELAHVLLDWFADSGSADTEAIATAVRAYRDAGGPARLTVLEDFAEAAAVRLNFLRLQLGIAADARAPQADRDWASKEIDEVFDLMPTVAVLEQVLAAATAA